MTLPDLTLHHSQQKQPATRIRRCSSVSYTYSSPPKIIDKFMNDESENERITETKWTLLTADGACFRSFSCNLTLCGGFTFFTKSTSMSPKLIRPILESLQRLPDVFSPLFLPFICFFLLFTFTYSPSLSITHALTPVFSPVSLALLLH